MDTSALRLAGSGPPVPLRLEAAPLGTGADGSVYLAASHPDLVVKLYHEPGRDPERPRKLAAMLQAPPRLEPIRHGGHRYVQLTWPTHLVQDAAGGFRGFAMPRVEMDRAVLLEGLLSRKSRRAYGLSESYGLRVTAASNLAAVVEALHACGHHVIDLKPVNAYVYRDTFFVALLDCDGFSVQGAQGERFPAHQYTQDYIAPEALLAKRAPEELGEAQDRFALAVMVFQLLNGGVHPFQGVPAPGLFVPPTTAERMMRGLYAYGRRPNPILRPSPWSIHESFDDATRDLFDRAFSGGPATRPSAGQWRAHLARYADPATGALKRCARDPAHAFFAAAPDARCILCEREGTRDQAVRAGRLPPEPKPAPHPAPPVPRGTGPTPPPGLVVPPAAPTRPRPAGGARTPLPGIARTGPHPLARSSGATAERVVAYFIVISVALLAFWMWTTRPGAGSTDCPVVAEGTSPRDTLTALVERASELSFAGEFEALLATRFDAVDARARTALHRAVMNEHPGGAMGLVRARVDLDARDGDGVTPLMMAAGRSATWYSILLLTNGADPDLRNAAGQTALMYAVSACPTLREVWGSTPSAGTETEHLGYYLNAGVELDARDRYGRTALMHATRGSGLWVRALLEAGADPYLADEQGWTVFRHAVEAPGSRGREYVMTLLQSVARTRGWKSLPREGRAAVLREVDGLGSMGTAAQRDDMRRAARAPSDSLGGLLPVRR